MLYNFSSVLCPVGEIRLYSPPVFPLIILGGFIKEEKEKTVARRFVGEPEGVTESAPRC